jgi:hypothetical protein
MSTTDTSTVGTAAVTSDGSASTTNSTTDSTTGLPPPTSSAGSATTTAGGAGHLVFATSTFHTGALGGLAGADTVCTSLANDAGLPGTFLAIMSDDQTAAADRLTIDGPVRTMDDLVVANDAADLWDGMLDAAIVVTELGTTDANGAVWTGTTVSGQSFATNCSNWTTSSVQSFGGRGLKAQTTADWIESPQDRCSHSFHLYCIEQ